MLKKRKVYVYDCFGTILLSKPSIKRIWNNNIAEKLSIDVDTVRELRRQAERTVASRSIIGEFCFNEMLQNFWQRYQMLTNFKSDVRYSSFYGLAVKEEIEDLKRSTYSNKKLVDDAYDLHQNGRTVIMLSDFYLGKKVLQSLLDNQIKEYSNGDLFSDIYVSCDINANKSSGTAYTYILNKYGLKPSEFWMTGDNIRSDYINAIISGMGARLCRDEKKKK